MANNKISIQTLIETISSESRFSHQETEAFIKELALVIQEYLEKDGIVKVKGLGTFKLVWVEDRKSVDVTTQKEIILPAHYKVNFTPDGEMKEAVNKPYAHLETIVGAATPLEDKEDNLPMVDTPNNEETAPIQEETACVDNTTEEIVTIETSDNEAEKAVVTEKQTEEKTEVTPTPKRKLSGWIIFLIILVLIQAAVIGIYQFDQEGVVKNAVLSLFNQTEQRATTVEETPESENLDENAAVETTDNTIDLEQENAQAIAEETADAIEQEVEAEVVEEIVEETTPSDQEIRNSYTSSSINNYPVRETVTVIDGSRLTMVAYRAYGRKEFWVYVYDANRNVLRSSADVTPGMQLQIRDLPMALVNGDDEACIQKALELAKMKKYK